MAKGIVRLEDMPSTITGRELPREIILPNPGDRKVVIKPGESGVYKKQVFTSDCLPDEIQYKLLGMVQYIDGNYYPKYVANAVTSQKLGLTGKEGAENGVETINNIAFYLTWQQGMLKAKSVKNSDLNFFDYKKERLSYWLASPAGIYFANSGCSCGPGLVDGSFAVTGHSRFGAVGSYRELWLGVRPVIVLASKIKRDKLPLVDL